MSSSPSIEQKIASPTRYHNRNNERFKAIMAESPPREVTKSSPLQPSRLSEYKVYETEKYATYEIHNEDRGAWREIDSPKRDSIVSPVHKTQETTKVKDKVEPTRISQPSTPAPSSPQPSTQKEVTEKRRIPHYMLPTRASGEKTTKETKTLGRRSNGGITKRVTTSKIPRYRSTTSINAIEEIQNEMKPGDAYVPMAARIQLYEKGLGNASNKHMPMPNKYNQPSPPPSRSGSRLSTPTSSQKSQDRSEPPSYLRPTSSSAIKKRKPKQRTNEAKPFRFTTSDNATFKEKLSLWRQKEHEQGKKTTKRKADHDLNA
ncbi:uncharacterized protein B0P05DRAFT_563506 [Gilbertella persicaria]|uniref:uncharacterized protein n=1 Tax=Gilbertella persicaria TaxID=101096 RepID=UPI00221E613C|nr:uncharacterized protein B0P05DRAFT_563506 [Gilbertella persicaria]KAI8049813.1 hypothetical protein B0P05DRAFT_563506 [Gilbertella persicaria]